MREPKTPTLSPQRLGRKRPKKPSQAPLETKNPDQRLRPTQQDPITTTKTLNCPTPQVPSIALSLDSDWS